MAGAGLGLALLAKETVLLLLLVVGLWLLWEERLAARRVIRAGASLLAGLLLCLSPLLVRNALVGAPLFALSNRAALAVIEGNAREASPVGFNLSLTIERDILERSDGRFFIAVRETLKTYQGDYAAFLRKQLLKLRGLIDPYEVPNNTNFYYGLEISPGLRFTLGYGVIFPLGVGGFLLSLPTWRQQRLMYLYLLALLGGSLFGVILARYRLILVPVLMLYAATFLVGMVDGLRERHIARVVRGLGLILLVAMVQHRWLPLTKPEEYLRPHEYSISAQIYASEDRFDRAVAELEQLREKAGQHHRFVDFAPSVALLEGDYRTRWANELLMVGKQEEARRQAERAEVACGENRDSSSPAYNLGLLYLKLDEVAKARTFFERFLEPEPEGPWADRARYLVNGLKASP